MRTLVFTLLVATLTACAPKPVAQIPACPAEGDPKPGQVCLIKLNGENVRITFGPETDLEGAIAIDVLGPKGETAQGLNETGIEDYKFPYVEDVDGDGRGDLLVSRLSGNANSEEGVWIHQADGKLTRVGVFNGVGHERTKDGYIAVPARDGAAAWTVDFLELQKDSGLVSLAKVDVTADQVSDQGAAQHVTCKLETLGKDSKMTAKEAEAKFCAEPVAANVFK